MKSYKQRVINYQTAKALIDAALEHAQANRWTVACSVLDPAGQVVASARMDGVHAAILNYAEDKAYTATLGQSSSAMFERMHSTSALELGLVNRPRLCVWEGGLPIYEPQDSCCSAILIGAIGVSGAEGPDDASCAATALIRLGLQSVG